MQRDKCYGPNHSRFGVYNQYVPIIAVLSTSFIFIMVHISIIENYPILINETSSSSSRYRI